MKGPFLLNNLEINNSVSDSLQYGVYVIVKLDDTIVYVGRSDTNLKRRIKEHVDEKADYKKFYYEEATSGKNAYEKECILWHQYQPRDNKIHPDHPDYSPHWKCPVAGCIKHY